MQLRFFRLLILLFTVTAGYSCFGQNVAEDAGPPVKFEISSIRLLPDEEMVRQTGDNLIDSGYAIKCRVSNEGRQTVYLQTDFANTIFPRGFIVTKTDQGLVWLLDASGKTSMTSPGLKPPYLLSSGSWLMLGEGDAVEWQTVQETPVMEELRANTIFIKFGKRGRIVEIFSNFFQTPLRNPK